MAQQKRPEFGDALRFLVMGDWGGSCYGSEPQAKVADQMAAVADTKLGEISFVLTLGDNFYRRGVSSVDDPQFKETFELVYTQPALQVPWYLIAGNRDHKGSVQAQIEYTKVCPRWNFPALYYTEVTRLPHNSAVTVQFIFLDTMLYLGPNNELQDMWLEDTLQTSTADWLFVCGHHPVYSAGRHGPTARLVNQLRPLLEKYRVAAYLCGHDHNLQHIRESSVDYFVSGAGYETCDIRKHESSLPDGTGRFFWPPQATPHGGFMSMEIYNQRSMVARFYDSEGQVLYTCSKSNPRAPALCSCPSRLAHDSHSSRLPC